MWNVGHKEVGVNSFPGVIQSGKSSASWVEGLPCSVLEQSFGAQLGFNMSNSPPVSMTMMVRGEQGFRTYTIEWGFLGTVWCVPGGTCTRQWPLTIGGACAREVDQLETPQWSHQRYKKVAWFQCFSCTSNVLKHVKMPFTYLYSPWLSYAMVAIATMLIFYSYYTYYNDLAR